MIYCNLFRSKARGFTFIEVLATLTFIAIVLPAVLRGVSLATNFASASSREAEAVMLANSLLAELVASEEMDFTILAGESISGKNEYRWTSSFFEREEANLRELEVTVLWHSFNREQNVTLRTLVYTGM